MPNKNWLTEAETHIDRAGDAVRKSPDELQIVAELLGQRVGQEGLLSPNELERLVTMRDKLVHLRSVAAYGKALYAGIEQVNAIGYGPQGLEQAL